MSLKARLPLRLGQNMSLCVRGGRCGMSRTLEHPALQIELGNNARMRHKDAWMERVRARGDRCGAIALKDYAQGDKLYTSALARKLAQAGVALCGTHLYVLSTPAGPSADAPATCSPVSAPQWLRTANCPPRTSHPLPTYLWLPP